MKICGTANLASKLLLTFLFLDVWHYLLLHFCRTTMFMLRISAKTTFLFLSFFSLWQFFFDFSLLIFLQVDSHSRDIHMLTTLCVGNFTDVSRNTYIFRLNESIYKIMYERWLSLMSFTGRSFNRQTNDNWRLRK